jgi:plastocyanin
VSITGSFTFSPADLTIHAGQNVTWTNNAGITHTVVSDANSSESFSSPSLGPGQSFTHEFDHIGDYSYHCGIHPSMTGTIHVIA